VSTFLHELETILKQRQNELPEGSYTAKLFQEGQDRILKKIGEEAGEVIIASKNNDPKELTDEMADLLFHMLVTLRHHNLSIDDVLAVLKKRHKTE
jgi:phosphoribosyl-ATP pyrophosphohydrolase/phosphoribosyl-AMP cyclohydrolase